ncbi:MAG TPA: hypothetical protein VHB50_01335, partial [Bryobacteraceae bacterium]|nr:hypothetical protein [Bryobacteraceae bacterium]
MNCAICGVRKPKRYCPGVQGEICTICCGTEREQSVDCPLDCEYLRDAHEHERHPELKAESIPNSDIEVSEEFLQQNEWVLLLLSSALAQGAMKNPGVTDYDIRDALDSLVQTYRTLQSGLYYEARSSNP